MNDRIHIGNISAPSGILVIIDTGYAGLWCKSEEDFQDDFDWPFDDETCEIIKQSVDFKIEGPDAAKAGRLFDRQWHPEWLYDIPRYGVEDIKQSFEDCIAPQKLNAKLVENNHRTPHPERTRVAIEHGNGAGEIFLQGVMATVCANIPKNRSLPVYAERMPPGPDQGKWRRIYVELNSDDSITSSKKIGLVGVDWARIMFADCDALSKWHHNDTMDGKADFCFWGRDEELIAKEVNAPELEGNTYGWTGLPIEETIKKAKETDSVILKNNYKVATDFRPHSHHWQMMEQVRNTENESGCIEIDNAKLCGFMTSWGDGIFDVLADYNKAGDLIRLTIDLGNERIVKRQRRFEEM